jgi:hypothetical protein
MTAKAFKYQVIRAAELVDGLAFSFESQPYLTQLFEILRKRSQDLTIVVGAGLSIESGLPSWLGLIDNIGRTHLSSPTVKTLSLLEQESIERKATVVLGLAQEQRHVAREYEIVRDALFPGGVVPDPGLLALSVARLVHAYPRTVRVLTTNYDPILEDALESTFPDATVAAYSPSGVLGRNETRNLAEWRKLDADAVKQTVFHLHGKVPVESDDDPMFPLVLTESEYFVHGPTIINAVAEEMADRLTVFLGLSMSDPNLLAALRHCRDSKVRGQRYAVMVPRLHHPSLTRSECAELAVNTAQILEKTLGLKPILMKTYAQASQVVADMALASAEPERYRPLGGSGSSELRYGVRFSSALKFLYRALGANVRTGDFKADSINSISLEMNRLMRAPGGPARLIKKFARKYKYEVFQDEHVALSLWLRDIRDLGDTGFHLRLVASSAYTHWENWSGQQSEAIDENSVHAAVKAVFQGQPIGTNIGENEKDENWLGAYAIPLVIGGYRSDAEVNQEPLDQLLVGSVSINSTAYVTDDAVSAKEPHRMSVLSRIDDDELGELLESIYAIINALWA